MTAREFAESTADTEQQADTDRRTSSPGSSTGALLALQASAGNGAVTRMLTVQRELDTGAPTMDGRTAAGTLAPDLQAEHKKLLADYQLSLAPAEHLRAQEAANELNDEGKAALAQVNKQQDALSGQIAQNEKDMRLLTEPGASDQALNEMVARRKGNATVGQTTDTTGTGWQVTSGGISSSTKTVDSQVDEGQSTTRTNTSTTTIDSTGWANKKTTGTTITDGDVSSGTSTATDRKIDVSGGNLNYTSGRSDKTENSGPNGSTSTTTGSSRTVGTSGFSTTTENTTTNGSSIDSTKTTNSMTRGDGKIGGSTTVTEKHGTQDGKGVFTSGSESSTTLGKGVIAGPDGVGAFGSAGTSRSTTHAKGVKTGQSAGVDGKVVANVTQVPGSDPAMFQITLTVNIGGKVGASGSAEHESERQGGKVSGSVSGSAALSGTGTFVHIYNEDETQKYLAQATAQGAGSGPKELQIVEMLAHGRLSDAKSMLNNVQASIMSAEGAAAMKDGESSEISIDLKGDVGATAGGDMAGMGGKVTGSVSRGGTLKWSVSRKGGKVVVGVAVTYSKGVGLGGSASFEMASGGYQNNSTESQTESATFTLDPDNHAYPEQFALLRSMRSVEELRHIRSTNEDLVLSYTSGTSEGATGTTTAAVGPVGLELTNTSTYDQLTSVENDGSRTDTYTGTKGGGAAITGPAGFRMAHSEKDTIQATSGPGNTASGDISTTTSDTSLGASWDALKNAWSDNKFGLATGSAKVMQETTEVCGMKLADGDFSTIAATAADPKRWQRVVESPQVFQAWMATGREIARAGGDRDKIAKALAVYGANNDGATHALERIVRSAGTAQGGTLYDWPGELSAEKAAYAALITGDPMGPAKVQRDAGNYAGAAETANGVIAKIDAMVAGMHAKQDKFSDGAALGEMLAAAAAKRGEIAKEAATFSHRAAGVSTGGVELPPPNVTTVPTAEQAAQMEIDQAAAKAELAGLQSALMEFEKRQVKAFLFTEDELDDMYVDTEGIMKALNELHDSVYPSWEKTLVQARAAATRAGIDPWSIQPTPGKGYFNELHHKAFGSTKPVYDVPPKPKS